MSKRGKVALGVTAALVSLFSILASVVSALVVSPGFMPARWAGPLVRLLSRANPMVTVTSLGVLAVAAIAGFGLLVYLLARVHLAPGLTPMARVLWWCGLLLLNAFILPVAWYCFVWREGAPKVPGTDRSEADTAPRSLRGPVRLLFAWFGIVAVAMFVISIVQERQNRRDEIEAARARREVMPLLMEEWRALPQMPGASEQESRRGSGVDTGRGGVWAHASSSYDSRAPYREILGFYDAGLQARGWRFSR